MMLFHMAQVSAEEAIRIAAGSQARLLATRRLILVLDLDHTLLNTVRSGSCWVLLIQAGLLGSWQCVAEQPQCMTCPAQHPTDVGLPPPGHLAPLACWACSWVPATLMTKCVKLLSIDRRRRRCCCCCCYCCCCCCCCV